jgi:hypothetical protein
MQYWKMPAKTASGSAGKSVISKRLWQLAVLKMWLTDLYPSSFLMYFSGFWDAGLDAGSGGL